MQDQLDPSATVSAGGFYNSTNDVQAETKSKPKSNSRKKDLTDDANKKRRCISSACVPCRKRKSKCDGSMPACSACAAVYRTECRYDPASDHRRKGVYKRDIDSLKTRNSTLQTLIQAILNYPEDEVASLVRQIRTCESLDTVAESILAKENGMDEEEDELELVSPDEFSAPTFESHLSGKMGDLMLEDGSVRYIGGTSVLLNVGIDPENENRGLAVVQNQYTSSSPLTSWTKVTSDPDLIAHLLNMYFCWHYSFFVTLSKSLFYRDFTKGKPASASVQLEYCSPLLVNAMLALGCHFTSALGAREDKDDSATSGDHFFREAKRLLLEDDLHEKPRLTTVQALALMSVREAGCGREAKGWVYSGMSFRMACDMGLNLDSGAMSTSSKQSEEAEDARQITFWGCFLFDKCWSNYLGRLPQLPKNIVTVPKFEVFPTEDAETWSAYTDSGYSQAHAQPARTRAVARQITALCEISSDLMNNFYNPTDMEKAKGKQLELKKLSDIHQRLEAWRRELPKELEPKEGGLPSMLVMHMYFQLLYIHLFRPFLKYNQTTSPLPANVSPRKLCTQAAATISKLLRLYKRSHGLRQICNIAVYIALSACTIHLLNLPDKIAKRDIVHGVKHLEEIADGWLCARRALGILTVLSKKWHVDLPEEAATVLTRSENKFGQYQGSSTPTTSPRPQVQDIAVPVQPTQTPISYAMPVQQPSQNYYSNRNSLNYTVQQQHSSYSEPYGPQATSNVRSMSSSDFSNEFSAYPPPPPRPQQLHQMTPSVSNTPQTNASTRPISRVSTTEGSSPSEIFGNIDQAIVPHEGEWYMRDQTSLATGFENWGMVDADLNNLLGNGQQQHQRQPRQHHQQIPQQQQQRQQQAQGQYAGIGPNGAGSLSALGNLAGLLSENEADWYQ